MPAVPRIARAQIGEITSLNEPLPVLARLLWLPLQETEDVQAWAIAVSPAEGNRPSATLIVWDPDGDGSRQDWIRTSEVRRPGEEYTGSPLFPWQPEPRLRTAVRPGPPRPDLTTTTLLR